jgi:hypothetical protein
MYICVQVYIHIYGEMKQMCFSKVSLLLSVEAHRVVERRRSHISYTIGSQMAVRMSDLSTDHPIPPGRFLVLIPIRGCVDHKAIVRLEELGQLKNRMTSSRIESATFRLVA